MKSPSKPGVIEAEDMKSFTREHLSRAMHCANLVGAFALWPQVERLADPDARTGFQARGLLRAMAESAFRQAASVPNRKVTKLPDKSEGTADW